MLRLQQVSHHPVPSYVPVQHLSQACFSRCPAGHFRYMDAIKASSTVDLNELVREKMERCKELEQQVGSTFTVMMHRLISSSYH